MRIILGILVLLFTFAAGTYAQSAFSAIGYSRASRALREIDALEHRLNLIDNRLHQVEAERR